MTDVGVVQEAVEDRRRRGDVAVQLAPVLHPAVDQPLLAYGEFILEDQLQELKMAEVVRDYPKSCLGVSVARVLPGRPGRTIRGGALAKVEG